MSAGVGWQTMCPKCHCEIKSLPSVPHADWECREALLSRVQCRGVRLLTREEAAAMDRALADSQTVIHEGFEDNTEVKS